jgi:hypothetical protein
MATLTVSEVDVTGVDIAGGLAAAAAGGDVFANDGKTYFIAKNTDASTATCTFASPATSGRDALAVANPAVTIAATTGLQIIGPFEPGIFNNSSGQVAVTYDSVTALTVLAVKGKY